MHKSRDYASNVKALLIRHVGAAMNIILISGLFCLAVVIFMPLFAETHFNSAERLIAEYLWKDAEAEVELAIKIDPYDSRYPARLGELLFTQSMHKDNPVPLLRRAEWHYRRAAELNPGNAGYFVKLGQIYINLFIDTQDFGRGGLNLPYIDMEPGRAYIDKTFENFRKAIERDPNGFNTAYAIGYSGLSVWKYLNEDERAIVIDRLKFSLKQKPWYSEYIYPRLMQETGNAKLLELIISEVEAKRWINAEEVGILKKAALQSEVSDAIAISDWQGTAVDGKNIYKDGDMYWSGTIYGVAQVPEGDAVIKVEASGRQADGVFPYMFISLDGKRAGSAYIDSAQSKEYSFAVNTDGGIKVLGITFTNDGGKDGDRNLYVGKARAIKR